jgi:hypothetical protein
MVAARTKITCSGERPRQKTPETVRMPSVSRTAAPTRKTNLQAPRDPATTPRARGSSEARSPKTSVRELLWQSSQICERKALVTTFAMRFISLSRALLVHRVGHSNGSIR